MCGQLCSIFEMSDSESDYFDVGEKDGTWWMMMMMLNLLMTGQAREEEKTLSGWEWQGIQSFHEST